jgi:hypothetical protein
MSSVKPEKLRERETSERNSWSRGKKERSDGQKIEIELGIEESEIAD